MADVAQQAGGIASLITYYAPGIIATVSPIALYVAKQYVQPTIDAIIALPALFKEQSDLLKVQNDLLKRANEQREQTALTLKEKV